MEEFWTAVLASRDATLAAIAAKAVKETRYHVRHAAEWVIRLGDGTGESARRLGEAQADLAHYTGEMFQGGPAEGRLAADGIAPDLAALRAPWAERVAAVFREACLAAEPVLAARVTGGRQGRHGEEMGHLLAELQYVQRTWPGLVW
jgi:ring-1,2-phenylacetyl-CoA epoxidase subunit PaaC